MNLTPALLSAGPGVTRRGGLPATGPRRPLSSEGGACQVKVAGPRRPQPAACRASARGCRNFLVFEKSSTGESCSGQRRPRVGPAPLGRTSGAAAYKARVGGIAIPERPLMAGSGEGAAGGPLGEARRGHI